MMRVPPPALRPSRDIAWCLIANNWARRARVQRFFAIVSRLGDGPLWYALIVLLPVVDGMRGLEASIHLAALAALTITLYRYLKRWTRRPRPFATHRAIVAWVAPLDEFSFPSGHTLHAVGFTIVACWWYPMLAFVLVPFSIAVALSRVVLGLHYPSDVLAATGIAVCMAGASLRIAEPIAALL
jgi:undecaprenyl-diphosphatase